MSKKTVSFVMDDKDWRDLEVLAKQQKTSVSTIIRQAIEQRLKTEPESKQTER